MCAPCLVSQAVKDKLVALKEEMNDAKQPVKNYVSTLIANKKAFKENDANDGDAIYGQQAVCRELIKDFTKAEEYKTLKACVDQLRAYKKNTDQVLTKAEAQSVKEELQKSRASGVSATDSLQFDTKLGKAIKAYLKAIPSTDKRFAGKHFNVKWNVASDLLGARPHGVAVSVEQLGTPTKTILDLEYYTNQKKWGLDMMKTTKSPMLTSCIVKPVVVAKLTKLIMKELPQLKYFNDKEIAADVAGTLQPQFTQSVSGSNKVCTSTDFGLVDVRIHLEGTEFVFGLPWSRLKGSNILDKHDCLTNMKADTFLSEIEHHGFFSKQTPGTMIVIPGTPTSYKSKPITPDDVQIRTTAA
jgi:hypothetical protein